MSGFWFNRLIEYWSLPAPDQVLDHVRRGRVQVVQMGNFGPDFYSLADDPDVERSWAGMPVVGIEANLERAAHLIPRVQARGARVLGQLASPLPSRRPPPGACLVGDVRARGHAEARGATPTGLLNACWGLWHDEQLSVPAADSRGSKNRR